MEKSTLAPVSPGTITVFELQERRQAGNGQAEVLDVRTVAEFAGSHVAGARSVPLGRLDAQSARAARGEADADCPLYVMCRSGRRSRTAVEHLRALGVEGAVNVEGGLLAWEAAGVPVERGASQVISLERQVRIGAGALVVLGVLLGAWLHPAFCGLSALVGAGLVFAGVTDTCGMGLLLARMPWNNRQPTGGPVAGQVSGVSTN